MPAFWWQGPLRLITFRQGLLTGLEGYAVSKVA